MLELRDRELANKVIDALSKMNLSMRIMHVCGTHQDTIVRYGLDEMLLASGIEVTQGPGCPVCVTTASEFEKVICLARHGICVTAFGDAYMVPGPSGSLATAQAEGFDTRIVYGISDAVDIAKSTDKEVVFMGVGFETTAPSTAAILLSDIPDNFSVFSCHRYVPPALHALLSMGDFPVDGLIEPGHVSTIIGKIPYEEISQKWGIPQVIAGFEP
ncbi:MAG: hydrogenase formation protein HypD, partial [Methermicoccaceae archaeon]